MSAVVWVGLGHGVLLSLAMTAIVVASLRHDPRIWQNDAPTAIQDLIGPAPPETTPRRRFWGLAALGVLVVVFASLLWQVSAVDDGGSFLARLLAAYVCFEVYNLVDATVIDVGLIVWWAPEWAFVPGTRGHPALRDRRFHVRNYLVGVAAGVPFAALWATIGFVWP